MSWRERKYLADKASRTEVRPLEFTPENLAIDLRNESGRSEFDIEFRPGPLWELDFIFWPRRHYAPFELKEGELPDWIEIEILGEEETLKPRLKWIWKQYELHLVCAYAPGATKALKRRWIRIRLKIEGESDREVECRLRRWRKQK